MPGPTLTGDVALDLRDWSTKVSIVKADAKELAKTMSGELASAEKSASDAVQEMAKAAEGATGDTSSLARAAADAADTTRTLSSAQTAAAPPIIEAGNAAAKAAGQFDHLSDAEFRAKLHADYWKDWKIPSLATTGNEAAAAAPKIEAAGDALGGFVSAAAGFIVADVVSRQLAQMASKIEDFSIKVRTADKDSNELAEEFVRAVPIIGNVYSAMASVAEIITGVKADLANANAELQNTITVGDELKAMVKGGQQFAKSMQDAAREARNAIEIINAPPSERTAILAKQSAEQTGESRDDKLKNRKDEINARASASRDAANANLKSALAERDAAQRNFDVLSSPGAGGAGKLDVKRLQDARDAVDSANAELGRVADTQRKELEEADRQAAEAKLALQQKLNAQLKDDQEKQAREQERLRGAEDQKEIEAERRKLDALGRALDAYDASTARMREHESKNAEREAAESAKADKKSLDEQGRDVERYLKEQEQARRRSRAAEYDAEIADLEAHGKKREAAQKRLEKDHEQQLDNAQSPEEADAINREFESRTAQLRVARVRGNATRHRVQVSRPGSPAARLGAGPPPGSLPRTSRGDGGGMPSVIVQPLDVQKLGAAIAENLKPFVASEIRRVEAAARSAALTARVGRGP